MKLADIMILSILFLWTCKAFRYLHKTKGGCKSSCTGNCSGCNQGDMEHNI